MIVVVPGRDDLQLVRTDSFVRYEVIVGQPNFRDVKIWIVHSWRTLLSELDLAPVLSHLYHPDFVDCVQLAEHEVTVRFPDFFVPIDEV